MDNFDYQALKDRIFHRKKIGADCADLERKALEYRRANNIFEVGDHILTNDDASSGKVYIVEKEHCGAHFKIRSSSGYKYCRLWRIDRHATDAEIKAGKRLPQLEVLDAPNTIILGDK